jgi:ATP-dependent helicase/nuclease subunit A
MLCALMNILEKNLLILASAGSGKTFQLGNRLIGLVAHGVAPEKIVALTFTRKAAGEFADSVLMKLAEAAMSDNSAARLREALQLPEANFSEILETLVRALPRCTLGTMDSFFAKVVRGFQYELGLTGGKFELLEGARAAAATDEILAVLLSETLDEGAGDDFLHAFRRACMGKEELGVVKSLRAFVELWQGRYRQSEHLEWGPAVLSGAQVEDWEIGKGELIAKVLRGLDGIEYTRKGHREAFEKAVATLAEHRIGSGSLASGGTQLEGILTAAGQTEGPLHLKYHKEFIVGGPAGDALRALVKLAASCEMAAAVQRTRAVRDVVALYDARCEALLRRRGQLGFDDVKILMGEWVTHEEARLRREAVDFRLDARYAHWLLDEFQDTSRADWKGLVPLLDEATGEGDGSLFVVGDRKQAIYGWRGGDVGLFDEVIQRYQGGGLTIAPMTESWRSCPEVLALVNEVCGDVNTLRELFGAAAANWAWETHVAAAPLAISEKAGEARVEVVDGAWEGRVTRLGDLIGELGIGERLMTCGVLVRTKAMVLEVGDHLRSLGYDVIEEGRRKPTQDHPVGIVLGHLLKWLANPADEFSKELLAMSPLEKWLGNRFGEGWWSAWDGLLGRVSELGFAAMMQEVVDGCLQEGSDFGKRRAGDIISALADLDSRGAATPQEAADWLDRLEISQNPGSAAVQVMTIHKAKGLGFDVVILPDVPSDSVPAAQRFEIAEGAGWLSETPPKWVRELIPEMREAEQRWADAQRYEAFCMLYVALTRSKRGLYVMLEKPAASQKADKPSLENWLRRSISAEGRTGIVYQSGSERWIEDMPRQVSVKAPAVRSCLGDRVSRRERSNPSGVKMPIYGGRSSGGVKFGTAVHEAFAEVAWADESPIRFRDDEAGRLVARVVESAELGHFFERRGQSVECLREQAVDAVVGGKWISGTVDRLHLYRVASGDVIRVEVIDFKTERVEHMDEIQQRYAGQMAAYRVMLEVAYPGAKVECLLVSTSCMAWIRV